MSDIPAKQIDLLALERRVVLLEAKDAQRDAIINKLVESVDNIKGTLNRAAGALLVITPLLAFLGSIVANKI